MIAEKLSYFIQTGQATQLMQQAGYRIGNIELSSFSPLPGVPAPAPGAQSTGLAGAGAEPTAQAGKLPGSYPSASPHLLSSLHIVM